MVDLRPAFHIALEVHGDKYDKGGDPILFHVFRVAERMPDTTGRIVALLHDVLEDCAFGDGIYWGKQIQTAYGTKVLTAVQALTNTGNDYACYIRDLSTNPLAVKVKLADLMDNMRMDRLAKLPPELGVRLVEKYSAAYTFLTQVERNQDHDRSIPSAGRSSSRSSAKSKAS